jgi:hypothetical protein
VKKLKSGLGQAISSTLIGLLLVTAVSFCVTQGWIPSYSTLLLSIFNIITSLLSMRKMRGWGVFYAFGWLAGAFIFNALGLFGTADIIFNIAAPIAILVLRFVLWVKNSISKAGSRSR